MTPAHQRNMKMQARMSKAAPYPITSSNILVNGSTLVVGGNGYTTK